MSAPTNLDDIFPEEDPYSWSPASSLTIQEFLSKHKPSMVQNDGTKPWIWVQGKDSPNGASLAKEVAAATEALQLLQKATERVEEIKNDKDIPVRSNKKTGAKSKKEVREQVQAEAVEQLKEISQRHHFVDGKWLIFAPSDKVDMIWASVAGSLVSGPLAPTVAFSAKVATSPAYETPGYQHVICLYIPDVYNQGSVTEVMKVLLRHHGLNLSGVKSNLYTSIGLDSKHRSGIPSTVWKNTALMKETEIKELKEAYFSGLAAQKAAAKPVVQEAGSASRKPALKKRKVVSDDPFASDDDSNAVKPPIQSMESGGKSETIKDAKEIENEESNTEARPRAKKSKVAA